MNDRVRELRSSLGLNQSEFAIKIGIGQAGISAIEKGIRRITDRNIQIICSTFNANEHWLRTGEGGMFDELSDNEETMVLIGKICSDDNKLKRIALQAVASIINDENCWNIIQKQIYKIIKEYE